MVGAPRRARWATALRPARYTQMDMMAPMVHLSLLRSAHIWHWLVNFNFLDAETHLDGSRTAEYQSNCKFSGDKTISYARPSRPGRCQPWLCYETAARNERERLPSKEVDP